MIFRVRAPLTQMEKSFLAPLLVNRPLRRVGIGVGVGVGVGAIAKPPALISWVRPSGGSTSPRLA